MSDPAASIVGMWTSKLIARALWHKGETENPKKGGHDRTFHARVSNDLLALARDIAPLAPCPCEMKEGV
ncbi:MAG: hypothetical protein ACRDBL_09565 [Rhabdaerophilum sp.]